MPNRLFYSELIFFTIELVNGKIYQMDEVLCFVAVEFPEDPNVAGLKYWYLCPFDAVAVGKGVIAPLGRHNRLQNGIVREVRFAAEYEAPYPLHSIKRIAKIV